MKKLSAFLVLISLVIISIFSCKKDKPDVATVDYGSKHSLRTTVSGIVLDESNAPLNGVTITAYGQTTTTNQYGTFVLKNLNVNKDRCVLQFAKTGFFKRAHGFIAAGNTVNYVRIILLSNAATQSFSSSAGGTVSLPDGSSAEFQPNSFVTSNGSAYSGTVNLVVKHLSPDDVNFGFMIPGGDLAGVNANNENVVLYTYGMLGVELTGTNGEALQLATGTSATLTLSIAASQLSSAPATIPLWFFDETTSLWKEEGSANKVGNNYVGTVEHFSWWNCDDPSVFSSITGKVIDCNGVGVPNVVISLNGVGGALTNQSGEFTELFITGATSVMELQVLSSNNYSFILNSQVEIIPSLSTNQLYIVPDLVIPCPTRITGTISGCNGTSTNAFVYASWNGGVNFQYCMSGSFNIAVPPNSLIALKIYEGSTTEIKSVTSGAPEIATDIGNTILCSNGVQPDNSFYVDGNGHNHELVQIDTTNTGAGRYASTSAFNINVIGINHSTGQPAEINIELTDSLQGNYLCDSSYANIIYLNIDNEFYLSYYQNVQSTVILNDVQYLGGRVKGTFSGTLTPADTSGGGLPVTISNGKFNVTRVQ